MCDCKNKSNQRPRPAHGFSHVSTSSLANQAMQEQVNRQIVQQKVNAANKTRKSYR